MEKIILMIGALLGFTILALVLLVNVQHGDSCAPANLTYAQRQMIAIEFMCGPGQHWKGMSAFCGAQILDDAAVKDSDGIISTDDEKDSKWWR